MTHASVEGSCPSLTSLLVQNSCSASTTFTIRKETIVLSILKQNIQEFRLNPYLCCYTPAEEIATLGRTRCWSDHLHRHQPRSHYCIPDWAADSAVCVSPDASDIYGGSGCGCGSNYCAHRSHCSNALYSHPEPWTTLACCCAPSFVYKFDVFYVNIYVNLLLQLMKQGPHRRKKVHSFLRTLYRFGLKFCK